MHQQEEFSVPVSLNQRTQGLPCNIGLLKFLSKYLPRSTLNELYKHHVRPHLDYKDVIYHIPAKVCEFSGSITLPNLMENLESVQYSAARAVKGT